MNSRPDMLALAVWVAAHADLPRWLDLSGLLTARWIDDCCVIRKLVAGDRIVLCDSGRTWASV